MTINSYFENLAGRRVGVVGIGVSNLPLIRLLRQYGVSRVTACDKRTRDGLGDTADELENLGVRLLLGEDYLENLDFDVIFRTPGLHPLTKQLEEARKKGAVLTSEMEAFFALCPCKTIAVTGSDGKTTTTTIISELLKASGHRVFLGGNIGKPLLNEIPNMRPGDFAVLELSSFQLHSMYCEPDVAVITNVAPNHLDVHPNMRDYVNSKAEIFRNQKGYSKLILNYDDPYTEEFRTCAKAKTGYFSGKTALSDGIYLSDGVILNAKAGEAQELLRADEILLPGFHNVLNYMSAYAAAEDYVTPDSLRLVARNFEGVAHRLELVRSLSGVRYINDSIASSPTRTIAGLRAFSDGLILIAGGYDKRIPFDELGREIVERGLKALILTGDTSGKINDAVTGSEGFDKEAFPILRFDDFDEAVKAAAGLSGDGDVVLLSPACASFDRFKSFAQRGERFREIVMALD